MARNIEIKARIADATAFRENVQRLTSQQPIRLRQVDVFFHVRAGRLKLRTIDDGHSELIYYGRDDVCGPKLSDYIVTPVADRGSMFELLSRLHGVRGEVRKVRSLFHIGQTRVHVDEVDGLGDFMELEVVLSEGQSAEEGQQVADELMQALQIAPEALVSGAYVDLLESRSQSRLQAGPS